MKARIEKVSGYSGHTDQTGLVNWLFPTHQDGTHYQSGDNVFITHGENRHRRSLAEAIQSQALELSDVAQTDSKGPDAIKVSLPEDDNGWFDLDLDRWEPKQLSPADRIAEIDRLEAELVKLRATDDRLIASGQDPL